MAMRQIKFDIFQWEILKSDAIFYQRILKYFSDFQNGNFSVLWLNWTQTMEMKQNEIWELRIIPWGIFKSGSIFNWSQKSKIFQWLL